MSQIGIAVCWICEGVFEFNPVRAPAVYFEKNRDGKHDPHWEVLCSSCIGRLKEWARRKAEETGEWEYRQMAGYRVSPKAYQAEP